MFWSRSNRKRVEDARRDIRARLPRTAANVMANAGGLAANAEAQAHDLSLAALDQLLGKIDELGDAFSALSQDAAALAKSQANNVIDDLSHELSRHPLRSLAIAIGVGMTAGLYLRK